MYSDSWSAMLPRVSASQWQKLSNDMRFAYYTFMRIMAWLLLAASASQAPAPSASASREIRTMSDIMVKVLYPTADAVFYIETRTPADEAGWTELQRQTRLLSDAAIELTTQRWARGREQWLTDAQL